MSEHKRGRPRIHPDRKAYQAEWARNNRAKKGKKVTLEMMMEVSERQGYQWLLRSVHESEGHMRGKYFAHIHNLEQDHQGYTLSYRGHADTPLDAFSEAYLNMLEDGQGKE